MKLKHFLLGCFLLALLFLGIGNASAQECQNVGGIIGNNYCDAYGDLKPLKNSGENCLNSYECEIGECIEEICQAGRFPSIDSDSETLLSNIWEFFSGEQCDPNFDTDYFCQGTTAFLCGENHVWEEKGQIPGVCGVPLGGGSSGGGGGPSPKIAIISPKDGVTYSNKMIRLEVVDFKKVAKYWRYSLNQGQEKDFQPNITITAQEGQNLLNVYASKYISFTNEQNANVRFNVVSTSSVGYCGNNVCDSGESCSSCERDCGSCALPNIGSYCGDSICDGDESSSTCVEDCIPKVRKDRMGLFYTIVFFLLASVGILGFFVVKRVRNLRMKVRKKPANPF